MQPVTEPSALSTSRSFSKAGRAAFAVLGASAIAAAFSACDLPLGLGQPTTRALENGVADTLTAAKTLEITGSYTESGDPSLPAIPASGARKIVPPPTSSWKIDLQLVKPTTEHVVLSGGSADLEAITIGGQAYFRGHQFLAEHMGSDPLSQNLVRAAGNAWWKGSAGGVPLLTNFIDGASFRATFLGPAVTQRIDHVSVDGVDAVNMSGSRADVFIASAPPHRVLRVHLKTGVVVDGISDGDLRFVNFDKDFGIAAPADVIDFSNLSTLTPIYTVVSVDTSGCGSQCAVLALVKNLGGMNGAKAPSTITFTMTDSASGRVLGSCQAQVKPDVGYNATTTVGCTIGNLSGQPAGAAIVTATADNPGRA